MKELPRSKPDALESRVKATDVEAAEAFNEMSGENDAVLRTFAKISSPENREVFSVQSALKAFAHIKVR